MPRAFGSNSQSNEEEEDDDTLKPNWKKTWMTWDSIFGV